MKRAIVVLSVLALLTASRQSTNLQWKLVRGIYGTVVPEVADAVVTLLAELPQGGEYVAFGYPEKNREYAEPVQFDGLVVSTNTNIYEDDIARSANCDALILGSSIK